MQCCLLEFVSFVRIKTLFSMFIKKLYKIFPLLDELFLRWIIFLLSFSAFSQTTTDSYENLWKVVENDTVSVEKKITYLDAYYEKARLENNLLQQYKALEKKTFLLPFNDAVSLLHQMHPLVQNIANDSIKGDFLNRSTVFYYKYRDFKNALYYAIASEAFNEEINNLYNLNAVRIDIGNIYHHTRYYDKAVVYFTQAKNYYQTQKDNNHLRSYVLTLYNLSRTYWQLQDVDKLTATIKESQQAITKLKPKHRAFETAYLAYVQGGLAFLQKNNTLAKEYFIKALPIIKQNGDFSNEHTIYLYLGKIAWQQNQKAEAVAYFNKIDTLFKGKHFLNYELREAYEYLITYYKETGQVALQNKATESLMQLNQQFEQEQQSITRTLNEELDQKKIQKRESLLQNQVHNTTIWLSVLGVVLLLLAVYLFWKRFKNKKKNIILNDTTRDVSLHFNEEAIVTDEVTAPFEEVETKEKNNAEAEKVIEFESTETKELSPTEQRLLKGLKQFERKKGFLKPITLEDLAQKLHTSRSTLSPFLNEHKGGFSTYVNKLRIQQLVTDLTEDQALRQKTVKELAAIYGDLHPKTFSILFKAEAGVSPSVFIDQLTKANL